MKKIRLVRLALLFTVAFGLALAHSSASVAASGKTLDNLMAAYNGESNAHAKYLEYAKKADSEGYAKVARLFRAAASAEKIHLTNHAQVIESMGGTPKADIQLPEIKTTAENLADAVKGETYERDIMYPGFIKEAQLEKNPDAVRTFTYAVDAEAEHAKLYQAALDDLANWKVADTDFYVCPVCGYTVENTPSFTSCPVCQTPASLYRKVS